MRIAYDSQAFVMQSYGGISRYFTRLAQGMSDSEQQVGIFASLHRNGYLSALPEEVVHGKYVDHYPANTARLFGAYNRIRSRFQMARWRPDLVHETYYSNAATLSRHSPVVITVYDMIHELFPSDFSPKDETTVFKRRAVERADHVICISENTKIDLMNMYGTSTNKLSVVHLGFDHFAPTADWAQFSTPAKRPFILYVGQRGGYKNFLGFLKAVSSSSRLLSDFDIVAFGGGRFSMSELREISELDFSENQVIHKSGSDELLGSLYRSATSIVYPSLYEGFGIPPLEAMAHQCPVISSNTSSMPEVIGSAAEYFDPADTDDIRRAIEAVVYSDYRLNELRLLGLNRIKHFSWDECSSQTLDIYKKLI